MACVAIDLLWISIFSLSILLLPETLALIVAVSIMLGHLTGAASWLAYRFCGYQNCNALFLTTAVLIVFAFKHADQEKTDDRRSTGNEPAFPAGYGGDNCQFVRAYNVVVS